jgi:hypothetical protein
MPWAMLPFLVEHRAAPRPLGRFLQEAFNRKGRAKQGLAKDVKKGGFLDTLIESEICSLRRSHGLLQGGVFFGRIDVHRDQRVVDRDVLDVIVMGVLDFTCVRISRGAQKGFEQFAAEDDGVTVLPAIFGDDGPLPAQDGGFEAVMEQ